MSYTIETKEHEAHIRFTLPWSDLAPQFDTAVAAAAKNVSVKGFRKGHVPAKVATAQVDRAHVLSDVVDKTLHTEYTAMAEKEDLRFAAQPHVHVHKLAEGNDVEIELVAALIPDVELPRDWKKIVVQANKEHATDEAAVADTDVDAELTRLAESRAEHKAVERAAANGDHVKVDFTVMQDGVVIEGGTGKDHSLVLGKNTFIPGFEEQVVGMSVGDEKTFELTFPAEYHAKHLAGKKASFSVKLKAVEERVVPAIDDVFAKSLGKDITDLAALRKNIADGMAEEKKQQAAEAQKTAILSALIEKIDVTLPEEMVVEETQRMLGEMEQQIAMSGMTFDDYLEKMNKTRDDLTTEWKPQAQTRVKNALTLTALADALEIDPGSDEIEAEMNKTLAMYKDMSDLEDKINMQELYAYTRGVLRNNKVFEDLLAL